VSAPRWSHDELDALNRLTTVARLLSTAVHDAGNWLQVVSGHAELLALRPGDPVKTQARALTIKTHAEQTAARLRELAALARPPEGAPRRLLLRATAERAVELRRYSLSRRQIAVVIADTGADVAVRAHETELLRLLANLILDAEEGVAGHTPAAMRLEVSTDGPWARLVVSRTGAALTAERLASLFDPAGQAGDPWASLAASGALATTLGGALAADAAHHPGVALVLSLPRVSE
jgi:C4-dicarboxylate-specific signal transduction histidine kinase